jgi:hypothetical protein
VHAIVGFDDADDVDLMSGANAKLGQRSPDELAWNRHLDYSHIRCEIHVLDQVRRDEPPDEPIRDVALGEHRDVAADLLQRRRLFIGIHLRNDPNVLSPSSQHHRHEHGRIERAPETDDDSVDIEDTEVFDDLFVENISPSRPCHTIGNLLDQPIVAVHRQDVSARAEEAGGDPIAEPAQPEDSKTPLFGTHQ